MQSAAVHRLVAQMAEGGAALLLTSREQPAQLSGEIVYPRSDRPLTGLQLEAAVALFFRHSSKAKDRAEELTPLALAIANATAGHPLAIALLAGEFDAREVAAADFLKNWENELANAKRPGLAPHHWTFAAAFERSYSHLTADEQKRLRALSVFAFPFFAQGARFAWDLPGDDDGLKGARAGLAIFTHRNLLEVDGYYDDKTPATFRFQPALRQEAARRVLDDERAAFAVGYAAYADWFVNYARDEIGKQPAIARLAQQAANELIAEADAQPADKLARYCWQLGIVLQQFGRIGDAEKILERGAAHAEQKGDSRFWSRLLVEQANIAVVRGELDRALNLFDKAQQLLEQLGDLRGKSATLHQMAGVWVTRGALDRAMALYEQSLQIQEQLGDLRGKSATLSNMANLDMDKGDWDAAESRLREALEISQHLQDLSGIAFKTVKLGQVAQARGDRDAAIARYREGLAIFERLGMPEAQQVREMIAALEGGAGGGVQQNVPADDPLAQAVADARAAAEGKDVQAGMEAQEHVVALLRERGEDNETLMALTYQLVNLASFYGEADRYADAVQVLEQAVTVGERVNHPDLAKIREWLENARHIAAMTPEERERRRAEQAPAPAEDALLPEQRAQIEAQFAALTPEQRTALEQAARQAAEQLARMSPAERAEFLAAQQDAARRAQIQQLADQARDAAIAVLRGQAAREQLLPQLEQVAAQAAKGETPDSPWGEVAAFLRAVIALLNGQPAPPVPAAYAAHLAAVQQAAKSDK